MRLLVSADPRATADPMPDKSSAFPKQAISFTLLLVLAHPIGRCPRRTGRPPTAGATILFPRRCPVGRPSNVH